MSSSETLKSIISLSIVVGIFTQALDLSGDLPKASEFRRWNNNTVCDGDDYDILSTDVMGECAPFIIPAPASIHVEYNNQTSYCSYHYQGNKECKGYTRKLVGCFVVGTCVKYTEFGDPYSQKRVWKY